MNTTPEGSLGVYRQSYVWMIFSLFVVVFCAIIGRNLGLILTKTGMLELLHQWFKIDNNLLSGIANFSEIGSALLAFAMIMFPVFIPGYPNNTFTIFPDRMVYESKNGPVIYYWTDVSEYCHDIGISAKNRKIKSHLADSIKLTMNDGHRFTFAPSVTEKIADLAETLLTVIPDHMLPAMLEQIKIGQNLTFDKLVVSIEGLDNGKSKISWDKVCNIKTHEKSLQVMVQDENGNESVFSSISYSESNTPLLAKLIYTLSSQVPQQDLKLLMRVPEPAQNSR
jgi:hypothetical protein